MHSLQRKWKCSHQRVAGFLTMFCHRVQPYDTASHFLYKPLFICLGESWSHSLHGVNVSIPPRLWCRRRLCQMTGTSLAVGGILFHVDLPSFTNLLQSDVFYRERSRCPPALLGSGSDINAIPLSTLPISHRLTRRDSFCGSYLLTELHSGECSISFSALALTYWSGWLDCLLNHKLHFRRYLAKNFLFFILLVSGNFFWRLFAVIKFMNLLKWT